MARTLAGTRSLAGSRTATGSRLLARDAVYSLDFDGVNDRVDISNVAPFTTLPFTFACWMKPDNVTGTFAPFGKRDGSSKGYTIYNRGNGKLSLWIDNVDYIQTAADVLRPKEWQHIVASLSAGGVAKIYRNGVQKSTGGSVPAPTVSAVILRLGEDGTLGQRFPGNIDEIKLFSNLLTDAEVLALYQTGLNPYTPLEEWLFNEGSGSTATGTGSGAHNGTIITAVYKTDVPVKNRSNIP